MEQSLQIGGVWSFCKAMSDRAKASFHKMQQGRDFFVLNCAFLGPLLLINVARSLTTLTTY